MRQPSAWAARALLAALLLLRLALHFLLYRSGFIALTADEFGRTIAAATWLRSPEWYGSGAWLPLYNYLLGGALAIKWELLWLPRLIAILSGLLAILLIARLTTTLFSNRTMGLVSALLLAVNPVHLWLSSTGLTEGPVITLTLAALWAFVRYVSRRRLRALVLAAASLAVANGLRYETWVISLLFAAGVAYVWQRDRRSGWQLPLLALIPFLFPMIWLFGAFMESGSPFSFMGEITGYKRQWYGATADYGLYLRTFWRIDPYLLIFGLVALAKALGDNRRTLSVWWYGAIVTLPLFIYILLHGGQPEPTGNALRYLAQYAIVFYPALSYLLVRAVSRTGRAVIAPSSRLPM